jgi:hypothetical protein
MDEGPKTSQLTEALRALDAAIKQKKARFHATMSPGASAAELDALRAEIGSLSPDVATWLAWHAGSDQGFIPGTELALVCLQDVVSEIRFVRSVAGRAELASRSFAPLLSAHDGHVLYYVAPEAGSGTAEVWEYDRGEQLKRTEFGRWLEEVREAWANESAKVRVQWSRVVRSPIGWTELVLPTSARAKLRKALACLPVLIDEGSVDPTARIVEGTAPGWMRPAGRPMEVIVTRAGADELAALLADKQRSTVRVPGIEDLRLGFHER